MKLKDYIQELIKFGEENPESLESHVATYDNSGDGYDIMSAEDITQIKFIIDKFDQRNLHIPENSTLVILN